MENNKNKAVVEAILFSTGREIEIKQFMAILELSYDEVVNLIESMKIAYQAEDRGIEIIRINESYQLCTKKEYYEYLYPIFDKRSKPNLSQAALETVAIIAYNPKITRAEIEAIRGVNSDGTIYKLLDYNLIQDAGKLDAPGRPTTYTVTTEFLKMFGMKNLEELPKLPQYRLDENQQIVIDEYMEEASEKKTENSEESISNIDEAPMPSEVQ